MTTANDLWERQKRDLPKVEAAKTDLLELLGFDLNKLKRFDTFFLYNDGIVTDPAIVEFFSKKTDQRKSPYWPFEPDYDVFDIIEAVKTFTPEQRKFLHDRAALVLNR